jgi:hypothetical protein
MASGAATSATVLGQAWQTFTADYGIQFTSLDSVYDALGMFWQPVQRACRTR